MAKKIILKDDEELPLEERRRLEIENRLEELAERGEENPIPVGELLKNKAILAFKQGKWDESNKFYEEAFDYHFERGEYPNAVRIAEMQWELAGSKKDRFWLRAWGSQIMKARAKVYNGARDAVDFAANSAIGDYAMNIGQATRELTRPETPLKKKLDYIKYISGCANDIQFYCKKAIETAKGKKK